MNLIQLEDARNLQTDHVISKGPDGRDLWKVRSNFRETRQVEVERTVLSNQPVDMKLTMSYKDLASGNWYAVDPQEFQQLAAAGPGKQIG